MSSSDRIRIAFLISSLANEGPVRVLFGILSRIDRSKFEPVIFTLIQERKNSIVEQFVKIGIPIVMPAPNDRILFTIWKRARELGEFDIVHAHCPRSLWVSYFLFPRSRICYTAHIFPGLQTDTLYGPVLGSIVRSVSLHMIRHIGKPIACSGSVSKEFLEYDNTKVSFVNNGCLLSPQHRTSKSIETAKARLGISAHTLTFLFVGRLSPEKNPLNLAKGFTIASQGKNWVLLFVGNGPLRDTLLQFQSEQVRIEGFHQNIDLYYQAADYYISPSLTEGLANTLLEATAYCIPPLLSSIPSHEYFAETIRLPKDFLFDPTDARKIAQSLENIPLRVPKELEDILHIAYERYFSADAMTKQYERVYESI